MLVVLGLTLFLFDSEAEKAQFLVPNILLLYTVWKRPGPEAWPETHIILFHSFLIIKQSVLAPKLCDRKVFGR